MNNSISWTKIESDTNGNPRYVCHYLNLLAEQEKNLPLYDSQGHLTKPSRYELAVRRARKIGGKKYHTKKYGGGIVFQSYNIRDTENEIHRIITDEERTA